MAKFDPVDHIPKDEIKKEVPQEVVNEEVVEENLDVDQEPTEENKDVHLNTDDTPDDDQIQEDDKYKEFWSQASEILDRDVTKLEDLLVEKEVEKVIEKEVIKETEYATEFSKAYDKFYKETGRPIEDFLSANVDPTTLSDEEIVKRSLKYNNPNFDKEDIDFLYNDKYSIDEDVMDEADIRRKNIARKQAINKGIKEIESLKQTFFAPLENSNAQAQIDQEATNKKIEENRKLWRDAVEASTSEFKGVDIKVSDNFSFTQKASPEDLKYVKEVVADDSMNTYLDRYKTKSGALDTKKMLEDQFFLRNKESIIAEAVKQAKAEERGEIIKQDKHIDFKTNKTKPKVSKLTKRQEEVADLLASKYKKRR